MQSLTSQLLQVFGKGTGCPRSKSLRFFQVAKLGNVHEIHETWWVDVKNHGNIHHIFMEGSVAQQLIRPNGSKWEIFQASASHV